MSNTKRLLSLILAVVMVFSLAAMVTGCKKDPGTADDATNPTAPLERTSATSFVFIPKTNHEPQI